MSGGNANGGTVGLFEVSAEVGSGAQCFWQTVSGCCEGADSISAQSFAITTASICICGVVQTYAAIATC